jgi:hypothetical protein
VSKARAEVRKILISSAINPLMQDKKTPTIASFSNNPELSNLQPINPDPERVDTRYLLSEEEINYIYTYETNLRESGLFEVESLNKTKEEYSKLISFNLPDAYDLEAYSDELELGIAHKVRVLTPEEELKKENDFYIKIEEFYSQVGNDAEKLDDTDLKKVLLNVSSNLRMITILDESIPPDGLERKVYQKNQDIVVYLRRRIIAEMIKRGIR